MNEWISGGISVGVTLAVFIAMKRLYKRFPSPFLLPLLTSAAVLISFLLLFHIPYDAYMTGGRWLDGFLGPAVVAMAVPLYRHRQIVKRYLAPILISVISGCFTAVLSGYFLAEAFGVNRRLLYTLLPKSVTTPVAMDLAELLGGIPSLAALFVIVAGLVGAVSGPYLMKWCKITHYLGKGIGLGRASHAIGTSKALEIGDKEGTASLVAMTLCAILTSVLIPLLLWFLH